MTTIFILIADKNKLTALQREAVTSGSIGAYTARFEFSSDWDAMKRVAVFKSGGESRSILLDETNTCEIPWEVLVKPGVQLQAGVYGTRGGDVVLPTIWASLGVIIEGVTLGPTGSRPPTPDLWEQELDQKGDRLDYTERGELGLYAGGKLLSAVPVQGGGGEGGASDHRLLSHRDAEEQHTIDSVSGLRQALSKTLTTDNVLSVAEILKIMEA